MSKIKATALSNLAGTLEVPVDTVVQGSAKAWVHFDGTGTVAIRAAFNVSSITDIATGEYIANFATALPDNKFASIWNARSIVATGYALSYAELNTTTSAKVVSVNNTSVVQDAPYVMGVILR